MDKTTETGENPNEIRPTDIVFECPHCKKSLAVDYRAAGLTVPCTDCKEMVEVPIPEGMDVSDLDSSEEDLRVRAIHLRESLKDSQARIRVLEGVIDELKSDRSNMERDKMNLTYRVSMVSREVEVLRQAVEQITTAMKTLARAANGEV